MQQRRAVKIVQAYRCMGPTEAQQTYAHSRRRRRRYAAGHQCGSAVVTTGPQVGKAGN